MVPAEAKPRGGLYGGFRLGGLQLALPIAALREVVPCHGLSPLPSAAAAVAGAIDLRGVLVPVLDLRGLIGHDQAASGAAPGAPRATCPNVVVMAHGGLRLGLLADDVTGVFEGSRIEPMHIQAPAGAGTAGAMLAGSVRRADTGELLSMLSPRALATLEHIPMIEESSGAAPSGLDAAAEAQPGEATHHYLLFRCGATAMAIDAIAVAGTVADPPVETSALAMGACRGVIAHGGSRFGVVDLAALCGIDRGIDRGVDRGLEHGVDRRLNRAAEAPPRQAIVLRVGAARVGLLVDEVLEIVSARPRDVLPLPTLRMTEAELFCGLLPGTLAPAGAAARARIASPSCLLLDVDALQCDPLLQGLARTNVADAKAGDAAGDARRFAGTAAAGGRSMLLYDGPPELATPITQIAEILPFPDASAEAPGAATLARAPDAVARDGVRGLLLHRGRSIVVLDLHMVLHGSPAGSPPCAVLVVQHGADWMGFAIGGLRAIEVAIWEPALLPARRRAAGDPPGELDMALQPATLALVGERDAERMVRVVDLQRLAGALLALCSPAAMARALAAVVRRPARARRVAAA